MFGGAQEENRRSGTENVPAIAGFGKAAEIAKMDLEKGLGDMIKLRDTLFEKIKKKLPFVTLNGHPTRRLPTTVNICFQNIESGAIVAWLDKEGICASTGAACCSGEVTPSHVLLAIGLTPEQALSSVRFSLGKQNTMEEINYVAETVVKVVGRCRKGEEI